VVQAETDDQALETVEHYRKGADYEAIANLYDPQYPGDKLMRGKELVTGPGFPSCLFYRAYTIAGSAKTIADLIEYLTVDGDFDGLLLSFPDYLEGLTKFGEEVNPHLEKRGLRPTV
jgi:pyrimidine oxygenase